MTLSAQISISAVAHEKSSGDLSNQIRVTPAVAAFLLGDGTGANQAQVAWSATRTIGATEYDDLTLTALADDRGVVSFSSIKAWYVKNTYSNGITLGRDQAGDALPSLPWPGFAYSTTSGFDVEAGGVVMVCNPSAAGVLVPSGHKIRISGPEGATYEILLIGEGTVS